MLTTIWRLSTISRGLDMAKLIDSRGGQGGHDLFWPIFP